MTGHTGAVNCVTISPDGRRGRALQFRPGRSHRTPVGISTPFANPSVAGTSGHRLGCRVFPDGKQALSNCSDGKTRLWDLATGKELLVLDTQIGGFAWTAAFTPDGQQAITGGGNVIFQKKTDVDRPSLRLWDLATGKEIRSFIGHTKDIRNVAIARDGKQLLSGSFDGTMRLWDIPTGKELKQFPGPKHFVEAVRFTPDGKRVICSYGPQVVKQNDDEDPTCTLPPLGYCHGQRTQAIQGT